MDNRIFNVNGRLDRDGKELLAETLRLAFKIAGAKASGFRICPVRGFVIYQYESTKATKFPVALTADQVLPQILAWFESRPACELKDWDANADHDGDNGPGWRVYCEDWGHVADEYEAFVAVKPAFMWYGK